jgi:hypothetical protein
MPKAHIERKTVSSTSGVRKLDIDMLNSEG